MANIPPQRTGAAIAHLPVMSRKGRSILVLVCAAVVCVVLAWWLAVRHLEDLNAAQHLAMEGHPTVEQMLHLLQYSDTIVLNNTLTQFERSRNPAGKERAAELLRHPDRYVSYSACLYLGAIGDERSIPYLIKGLDHPAWRSRPRVVKYLKSLTGQDFGEDKEAWIRWWNSQNPGSGFDFANKQA
ncbi:MAG TPA: HEAT repeat domain-containing protein [Candidatus Acidoferrum sp.]|nr:HEAT repeat domain-containing protein [Candidatus Acidoferrum sp.]